MRRRKQPFTTPIASWFFDPRRPCAFVDEALSPTALRAAHLFDPGVVERLRRELALAPAGSVDRLRRELVLMLVLSTQLVHTLFVDGHDRPASRFALPEPWS